MNKTQIKSLGNEELIVHAMKVSSIMTKEENFRKGGMTKKTSNDYKWTTEVLAERFNLDLKKIKLEIF